MQSLKRPGWLTASVLVAALLAGACAAYLAIGPIFNTIDNEFSRVGAILDALADPDLAPEAVILGNSIGMYGIDARRLSERLPGEPLVLNLTSGAQQPAESYLYYQELPDSVRLILQVISPSGVGEALTFDAQRYNTYFMYGYRPTAATTLALTRIFGEEMQRILGQSTLEQKFRARWAIRNMVEMQARTWLRPELDLARSQRDLYFPNPEEKPLPKAAKDHLVNLWVQRWPVKVFEPLDTQVQLLHAMIAAAESAGKAIVFLVPPTHPVIRESRGDEFYAGFMRTMTREAQGWPVIEAIDLLPDEAFVDNIHPTRPGAAIWTDYLAERITVPD